VVSPRAGHGGGRPVHDVGGKEVTAMDTTAMEWEPPEFEEVGTSAEVTAYAGRWDDDRPWD
jgi:coenzyme PQQ precursor peptide PqqA